MRSAILLARKSGKLEVLLLGVDARQAKDKFKSIVGNLETEEHKTVEELELWVSDAGRVKRAKFCDRHRDRAAAGKEAAAATLERNERNAEAAAVAQAGLDAAAAIARGDAPGGNATANAPTLPPSTRQTRKRSEAKASAKPPAESSPANNPAKEPPPTTAEAAPAADPAPDDTDAKHFTA